MGTGKSLPYLIFYNKAKYIMVFPKPGVWTKYIKIIIGLLLIISLVWLSSLLLKHYSGSKKYKLFKSKLLDNWEEYNEESLFLISKIIKKFL